MTLVIPNGMEHDIVEVTNISMCYDSILQRIKWQEHITRKKNNTRSNVPLIGSDYCWYMIFCKSEIILKLTISIWIFLTFLKYKGIFDVKVAMKCRYINLHIIVNILVIPLIINDLILIVSHNIEDLRITKF